MNNEPIPIVDHIKYLGHILSNNKNDDLHIEMCSIEVKVELFKTYCTPLYTAHLWTNYTNQAIKNFYIAYHNVMKLFIGLPKWEHNRPQCVQHNIPHGPALLRNFIYKFIKRLYGSENKLLYEIARSDCFYESQIRKKWRSLLYT